MTVTEIIEYWGYPSETHKTTTSDGYILTLFRIPHGKTEHKSRPVVFLQHGLLMTSAFFITSLPEYSIAFLLADAGFDVWLGNSRGSVHGKEHAFLDVDKSPFWEFSSATGWPCYYNGSYSLPSFSQSNRPKLFDEMAAYDLDASIDCALNTTGLQSLYYIGHSQGALIMFSKLAIDPAFGKKIRQFHAIAPPTTVRYANVLLRALAEEYLKDSWISYIIGHKQFLASDSFVVNYLRFFCNTPGNELICDMGLNMLVGFDSQSKINITRMPVFLVEEPGGTSVQNMLHWSQMMGSGKHQMYDYGTERKNRLYYGQDTPPVYNISRIETDMYIYWSDKDWLADEKDINDYLLKQLNPVYVKKVLKLVDYNHVDFIWANSAVNDLFIPIIDEIKHDN